MTDKPDTTNAAEAADLSVTDPSDDSSATDGRTRELRRQLAESNATADALRDDNAALRAELTTVYEALEDIDTLADVALRNRSGQAQPAPAGIRSREPRGGGSENLLAKLLTSDTVRNFAGQAIKSLMAAQPSTRPDPSAGVDGRAGDVEPASAPSPARHPETSASEVDRTADVDPSGADPKPGDAS